MAQDQRKRQQKLQKKAIKRKSRQQELVHAARKSMQPSLRKAGEWPLHEVWINGTWRDPMILTQIVISRRTPNGYIAAGNFLIDRACLGVKNAFGKVLSEYEYKDFVSSLGANQSLIPGDLNLAAKIIHGSIAYARQFGFQPNRDTPEAMYVLGDADPELATETVSYGGKDGKPFYQAGPYDDIQRIVARLTKAVGPDGFTYLLPLDLFDDDFDDDDDIEDDTIEFDDD